jgi:hypothetical protein
MSSFSDFIPAFGLLVVIGVVFVAIHFYMKKVNDTYTSLTDKSLKCPNTNGDCDIIDEEGLDADDVSECQQLCDVHSECNAYAYIPKSKSCHLRYYGNVTKATQYNTPGVLFGWKPKATN